MSHERILVVDDSDEVRNFLVNGLLKPEGYVIETARDGLEGMEVAVASRPDLIITDHAMPKMNGLEMIAGLRAQGLDTPAILMTAEGSEEIASQAFRVGIRFYFIKPFDPAAMHDAILSIYPATETEEPEGEDEWGGAQAQALLGALDDAVFVVNNRGRLRYANTAAAPFLKKPHPNTLFGKKLSTAIKDQDLLNLLSGDIPPEGVELATHDDHVVLARMKAVEGVGRVIVLEDNSLQQAIDEKRSEFVATVAHDLRSPLTGILSYLELMSRVGKLTPQQKQFTNQMREAVQRMTALLNDLLELSRIESGREQQREPVSLAEVAEDAARHLKNKIDSKGQKLEVVTAASPLSVMANSRRLYQVFSNLIENAIKYTPEGGKIKVSLMQMEGQAMATVIDTGIGIAQKDIPHVFDKFYRVEEVASSYDGTGLGLSIVKSIVEAYNGRIWVESSPGMGSSFTVVLPELVA